MVYSYILYIAISGFFKGIIFCESCSNSYFVEHIFVKMINDQTMEPHDSTTQLGLQMTMRSTKSMKIVPLKKPLIQWCRKMIQEGGASEGVLKK